MQSCIVFKNCELSKIECDRDSEKNRYFLKLCPDSKISLDMITQQNLYFICKLKYDFIIILENKRHLGNNPYNVLETKFELSDCLVECVFFLSYF